MDRKTILPDLLPVEVTDLDYNFPAHVIETLLPEMKDIPDEFKSRYNNDWVKIQEKWFFCGLKGRFVPKPGIDINLAIRHLSAIQHSFEPKHEHKTSGVAYLMSLWFEKYEE